MFGTPVENCGEISERVVAGLCVLWFCILAVGVYPKDLGQ